MRINQTKRIGFIGCRVTTEDVMRKVLGMGYEISYLITVSSTDASERYHISGYMDLETFAKENSVPTYHVHDYALKSSSQDIEQIASMNLDLLIVLGWQRIIPVEVLELLSIGAIGMHGASQPPPFGRGHSVMNWSIIEGRDNFYAYLFKFADRVDAGPIIGIERFDINPWDTCETLHYKYEVSMARLLERYLPEVISGNVEYRPQSSDGASYYPRRTPEDGIICWQNSAGQIHRLIKAVTKPYPGARTKLENQEYLIWRGQLFDTQLSYEAVPGTVVEVFYSGDFVVMTGEHPLLINEYDGRLLTSEDVGKILGDSPS